LSNSPVYIAVSRLTTKAPDKKGVLKPDSEGYYTVVLGGLNVLNSSNCFYPLDGNREMFEPNSILQRRIQNGHMYMEMGHPKREPGMTDRDWFVRVLRIEEKNHCGHIKEVWLEENYKPLGEKNSKIVAIIGKVKPTGPYKESLEEYLKTPSINAAFSVRSFTNDKMSQGTIYKYYKDIICWDFVTEPGIANATKWDSPGLESIHIDTEYELMVTSGMVDYAKNMAADSISVESKEFLESIDIPSSNPNKIWKKW